jgi:hypothetical protein
VLQIRVCREFWSHGGRYPVNENFKFRSSTGASLVSWFTKTTNIIFNLANLVVATGYRPSLFLKRPSPWVLAVKLCGSSCTGPGCLRLCGQLPVSRFTRPGLRRKEKENSVCQYQYSVGSWFAGRLFNYDKDNCEMRTHSVFKIVIYKKNSNLFIYINRGMQEGCINLLEKYFN